MYPMVPGHEIVGRVTQAGANVKGFKPGDLAGVGCFVDSCRVCRACRDGLEQYCEGQLVLTYNGFEKDMTTRTFGGYSSQIVVDTNYVLRIPPKLPLPNVAPLLCAGITTYSPLRHFGVDRGTRVAVVGLGGLGHMGVKLAAAMGAEVSVLSTSRAKERDARRLGAQEFTLTTDPTVAKTLMKRFDFILDCISAPHDLNLYTNMLRRDGTLALVGVSPQPAAISTFPLILGRKRIAGSLIGGIRETQEMLDFCADHDMAADVEVIPIQEVEAPYERTIRGDVRYRFVIDMKTI
jgi:alcohol dehydrogenase (NADP+)